MFGSAPDGGAKIEHGRERLPLLMSGRATYRSVERSAAPKTGEIVYHEYASGDRRVTYECRGEERSGRSPRAARSTTARSRSSSSARPCRRARPALGERGIQHRLGSARVHQVAPHHRGRGMVGHERAHLGARGTPGERLGGDDHDPEGARGDAALQRGRDEAQNLRPPAGRRRVEVGRAPDAAVDVLAVADPHRREHPRHGAEASTARETTAAGAPGAPNITRRPLHRSTAAIRSRPSKLAPSDSRCCRAVRACASCAARRAQRGRPHGPADRRHARQRDRGERARGGDAGRRPTRAAPPVAPGARVGLRRLGGPPHAPPGRPPGLAAGGQRGRDDRARGGADEVFALAQAPVRPPTPARSAAPRIQATPSVPPRRVRARRGGR